MIVMPSGRRSSDPMPWPKAKRKRAEQRRHGGHQDRPEAQQAGFVDRVARALVFLALGGECEIDHHDGVLLHDADQQNDADHGDDAQIGVEQHQRQQRADAGRRQRGENRDRVNVALVQHAENDVDRGQRRGDQHGLVAERVLIGLRGSGERGAGSVGGRPTLRGRSSIASTASPSATSGREIEGDGHRRETNPGDVTASGAVAGP